RVVRVGSAAELRAAVAGTLDGVDVVVMAAAVADFRPSSYSMEKIKKGAGDPPPVPLERNPDVLAELAGRAGRGYLAVGFAAETSAELERGRAKLAAKGADLLVVNRVGDGAGFEVGENTVTILDSAGGETAVGPASKDVVAHAVWDAVRGRLVGG
ncbi:MAG: phosphopantothenoylcysteine decarboxylase domain-containing protein, partial [Mycobacteriales bacterium]